MPRISQCVQRNAAPSARGPLDPGQTCMKGLRYHPRAAVNLRSNASAVVLA